MAVMSRAEIDLAFLPSSSPSGGRGQRVGEKINIPPTFNKNNNMCVTEGKSRDHSLTVEKQREDANSPFARFSPICSTLFLPDRFFRLVVRFVYKMCAPLSALQIFANRRRCSCSLFIGKENTNVFSG